MKHIKPGLHPHAVHQAEIDHKDSGFSLIELLIALAIFALVSLASLQLLRIYLSGNAQALNISKSLAAKEYGQALMRADFSQIINRSTRAANGPDLTPGLTGGQGLPLYTQPNSAIIKQGEILLVHLVHQGYPGPDLQAPRSSLQSVHYLYNGQALIRRAIATLDGGSSDFFDQVIASPVTKPAIRFYNPVSEAWQNNWQSAPYPDTQLPAAIAISWYNERGDLEERRFIIQGALE